MLKDYFHHPLSSLQTITYHDAERGAGEGNEEKEILVEGGAERGSEGGKATQEANA